MSDRSRATGRARAVQDFRATSDSIRADVRRLDGVEEEKERLAPEDPEIDRLSREAAELGDRINRQTKAERQLAGDIS